MNSVGTGWLLIQLIVGVVYVLLTVKCLNTKRANIFCGRGFGILAVAAVITPGIAVLQSAFWSYLGLEVLLWWPLLFYEGTLLQTIQPENKAGVFALVPVMCWFYGWPIGGVIYVISRVAHQ